MIKQKSENGLLTFDQVKHQWIPSWQVFNAHQKCLVKCTTLAELQFTWNCTHHVFKIYPEQYKQLQLIKDTRKAEIIKESEENGEQLKLYTA